MDESQIWEQLDLRAKNICQLLERTLGGGTGQDEIYNNDGKLESAAERMGTTLEALAVGNGEDLELDFLPDHLSSDDDSSLDEDSSLGHSDNDQEEDDESGSEITEENEEGIVGLRDSSPSESSDQEGIPSSIMQKHNPSHTGGRSPGAHPELDDGFFNLATFNAETERAEARYSSRGHLSREGDDDDDDDDAMSVDLFALVDHAEGLDERDDAENELEGKTYVRNPCRTMG